MLNSPARHESTAFPSRFAFLSTSAAMERTGIACATPVISLQKLKNFLTQPRFRFPHHGEYNKQQHALPSPSRTRRAPSRCASMPNNGGNFFFISERCKQIQKHEVALNSLCPHSYNFSIALQILSDWTSLNFFFFFSGFKDMGCKMDKFDGFHVFEELFFFFWGSHEFFKIRRNLVYILLLIFSK